MHSIDLPPFAPTLIESTRAIGYSLEAAVADIVDNSITAQASSIQIFFFPINSYIAILDNGVGMNDIQITKAMQYGSRSPSEQRETSDLGRFGLGLKTASLSQCRRLTVVSKNNNRIEARCWDIDHVIMTGQWSLLILDADEIQHIPHILDLEMQNQGTLVVWQQLDRIQIGEINLEASMGRKMDVVRDHLALIYHRYLAGEHDLRRIQIAINNLDIIPIDPFLTKKSTQIMDDEKIVIGGEKIAIRSFILPHVSRLTYEEIQQLGGNEGLQRLQGFYVYRNKRLLVWGTWFRLLRQEALSKLARIQVDVPNTLDDLWSLDIKKSSAIPPSELRDNLKRHIHYLAEQSKRTWTFRGKKEISDTIIHMWNRLKQHNGGIKYAINRDHPLISSITLLNPAIKHKLDTLLNYIEASIPLHSLYVDLNNDDEISNKPDFSDEQIEQIINQIVGQLDRATRIDLLDQFKHIEPFMYFPHILKRFIEKEG